MNPAIRSKVLAGAVSRGLGERKPFTGDDSDAIPRVGGHAVTDVIGRQERVHVVPIVRKQCDGIRYDGGRHVRIAPSVTGGVSVEIALQINGILGCKGQTAIYRGTASGTRARPSREQIAVYDLHRATEEERRVFPRFVGMNNVCRGPDRGARRIIRNIAARIWRKYVGPGAGRHRAHVLDVRQRAVCSIPPRPEWRNWRNRRFHGVTWILAVSEQITGNDVEILRRFNRLVRTSD